MLRQSQAFCNTGTNAYTQLVRDQGWRQSELRLQALLVSSLIQPDTTRTPNTHQTLLQAACYQTTKSASHLRVCPLCLAPTCCATGRHHAWAACGKCLLRSHLLLLVVAEQGSIGGSPWRRLAFIVSRNLQTGKAQAVCWCGGGQTCARVAHPAVCMAGV